MPRIAGIDLAENKRIDIALTAIYGIGRVNVKKILREAEIDSAKRVKELNAEEVARIQKIVENIPTEGTLRKKISQDIERLRTIRCYRGIRHIMNLPVRGQRTRSNARTKRGKRKTIGAIKKKDMAKFEKSQQEANES
jgi:small subunit ribosomal protein S13